MKKIPRYSPVLLLVISLVIFPVASKARNSGETRMEQGNPDGMILQQLLQQSGFPYRKILEDVFIIERTGTSLGKYKVLLGCGKGMMFIGVIIAEKKNINASLELMLKLLKLNDKMDFTKVGFDDSGDLFIRFEAKFRLLDLQEFRERVSSIEKAADWIHKDIKPFLTP